MLGVRHPHSSFRHLSDTVFRQPEAARGARTHYSQDWLYDSATGLYWQILQIPTATFATDHGTIATDPQISQLSTDAGMSGISLLEGRQTATYSQSLANFLSFLEFDAPARSAELQKDFNFSAVYYYPGDTLYPATTVPRLALRVLILRTALPSNLPPSFQPCSRYRCPVR